MPAFEASAATSPLRTSRVRSASLILPAIILLALLVRVAAALVLRQPLESDSLAYFTMARTLIEQGVISDNFGQHAFYSAGYPLLLAPAFLIFGTSLPVALAVNLGLTAISIIMLHRLARMVARGPWAANLAALALALWLPSIWNATMLAKENLSTPLLLGLAYCALRVARGERVLHYAAIGGLLWGAGLITGGSSILLCLGMGIALIALWRQRGSIVPALGGGALFAVCGVLALAPWLVATERMVGRPVLTTNAAFNLYLGNNPAATGRFVSIADTPLGAGWQTLREMHGETGTADILQSEASAYMRAHPGRTLELAVTKLAIFWQPNIPDAADFAASKAVASLRLIDVAQYALIILLALVAIGGRAITGRDKAVILAMVAGFWLVHALTYIIPRYRDPVIPLLILLGAAQLGASIMAWWTRRTHAA